MANDLNIPTIASGQADGQWQTSNDGDAALGNALADIYTVDFTAGNVTLTASQFRAAMTFVPSNLSATRNLTIPSVKRALFLVNNTDAADTINVTHGSTVIAVAAGEIGVFSTDGTTNNLSGAIVEAAGGGGGNPTESLIIAVGDETTAITTGTAKVTFRMPYAFTLSDVRASLVTAQTSGSTFTVDINEGGASILSTKLTIDNTEKTSTTAAAAAVISDSSLADDAEITIDVDQVGDGTAAGLKVVLIGART